MEMFEDRRKFHFLLIPIIIESEGMQPEQLLAVHFKLFLCQALPFKTKNVKDVDQAYGLVEPFDQVLFESTVLCYM